VKKGKGEVWIDGKRTKIKSDAPIVVPAGARHNVINTDHKPMVVVSPTNVLIPIVSAASLGFLALLGAIGARTGGANVLRATVRVTFWGALALAITAGIGKSSARSSEARDRARNAKRTACYESISVHREYFPILWSASSIAWNDLYKADHAFEESLKGAATETRSGQRV
jgi:hypothetical protein